MPESHHETDSAVEPISGEAPEVARPISQDGRTAPFPGTMIGETT